MYRIGLAQSQVSPDKQQNLALAETVLADARDAGVELLVFPEIYMATSPPSLPNLEREAVAETVQGPFVTRLRRLTAQLGLWTVFGMLELPDEPDSRHRVFNTVVIIDNTGNIAGRYRKSHLYDAFSVKESDMFLSGDTLFHAVSSPFGRLGLLVCYELRFPEVARTLVQRRADVLLAPSAWYSGPLKELHWSLLVQTRALENTVFVAACNQTANGFTGRSQLVDPLGVPLVQAGEEPQLIMGDVDLDRIRRARTKLPTHEQARPSLYTV